MLHFYKKKWSIDRHYNMTDPYEHYVSEGNWCRRLHISNSSKFKICGDSKCVEKGNRLVVVTDLGIIENDCEGAQFVFGMMKMFRIMSNSINVVKKKPLNFVLSEGEFYGT